MHSQQQPYWPEGQDNTRLVDQEGGPKLLRLHVSIGQGRKLGERTQYKADTL